MLYLLLINDCSFSCHMKEASNIMNATNEGLQHELDGLHGLLTIIITSSCNHHIVIKIKVHFKNACVVNLTLKKNILSILIL